jgi:hypothetical protein
MVLLITQILIQKYQNTPKGKVFFIYIFFDVKNIIWLYLKILKKT